MARKPVCQLCGWSRCPTPVTRPDPFAGLADVGPVNRAPVSDDPMGGFADVGPVNPTTPTDDPFGGLI